MSMKIKFRAENYSGGTSYVPASLEDGYLMQHCLNTDLVSINHHGMEKLKIVAKAHGWVIEIV